VHPIDQNPNGLKPVAGMLLNPLFESQPEGFADIALLPSKDIDTVLSSLRDHREVIERGKPDTRRWDVLQSTLDVYEGHQRAALDKAILRITGMKVTGYLIHSLVVCPAVVVSSKDQSDIPIPGVLSLSDASIVNLKNILREALGLGPKADIRAHPWTVPVEDLWRLREDMQNGKFDSFGIGMDPPEHNNATRYDWYGDIQNTHIGVRCLVISVTVPRADEAAVYQVQRTGQGNTLDLCNTLAACVQDDWADQIQSQGKSSITFLGAGIWPEMQSRLEQIAPLFVLGAALDDLIELQSILRPKLAASVTLQSAVLDASCTLEDFIGLDSGPERPVVRVLLAQADAPEDAVSIEAPTSEVDIGSDESQMLDADTFTADPVVIEQREQVTVWMQLDFAIGPHRRAYRHILEDIASYLRHRGLEHVEVSEDALPLRQAEESSAGSFAQKQIRRLPHQYGEWRI